MIVRGIVLIVQHVYKSLHAGEFFEKQKDLNVCCIAVKNWGIYNYIYKYHMKWLKHCNNT